MAEGIFHELLKARRKAKDIARNEESYWITKHGEQFFSSLDMAITKEDLFKAIEAKHQEGKKVYALGLMGSGEPLIELANHPHGLDRGLAVALSDTRLPDAKQAEDMFHIDFLSDGENPNDLLSPQTWTKINEWLKTHTEGQGKFDFIFSRPLAGLAEIPKSPDLYYWLLNNAYTLLSEHDGILVTQTPIGSNEMVSKYVEGIKGTQGLEANVYTRISSVYPILKLVKHKEAPAELPKLAI